MVSMYLHMSIMWYVHQVVLIKKELELHAGR